MSSLGGVLQSRSDLHTADMILASLKSRGVNVEALAIAEHVNMVLVRLSSARSFRSFGFTKSRDKTTCNRNDVSETTRFTDPSPGVAEK